MSDIIEFLEARIAKDERRATDLLRDLEGEVAESYAGMVDQRGPMTPDRLLHATMWAHYDGQSKRRSFARGQQIADLASPTRVLAECAAKRAIVAEHELSERSDGIRSSNGCVLCNYNRDYGWEEVGPCRTLRALASVYADHPDYRQEWAVA